MNKHWPDEDLMATEEKARVAVSSRGFASAAAEGSRTTPARETEMTVAEPVVAVVGAVVGADVTTATLDDTLAAEVLEVVVVAGAGAVVTTASSDEALVSEDVTVTVTNIVEVAGSGPLHDSAELAGATEVATSVTAGAEAEAEADASPKVKD